jgi:hypothetical protein
VWGFDLGLLFTTQKTVSLVWLSLAAVVLLDPVSAPLVLVCVAITASLLVALWSLTRQAAMIEERRDRIWVTRARRLTGAAMMAATLGLVIAAVQA